MFMIKKYGNFNRIVLRRLSLAAVLCFALIAGVQMQAHAFDALVVKSGDLKPYDEVIRGFTDACNCKVEEVAVQEGDSLLTALQRSPSLVLAIGTTAFRRTKEIDGSLVYAMVIPIETTGQLKNNIIGVSMDISPTVFMAYLTNLLPQAKRVGILYDPHCTAPYVEDVQKAAAPLGIQVVARQVQDASEVSAALNDLRDKIDVLWMLPDSTVASPGSVQVMLRYSFQHNVPLFTFSRKYVDMGAVASLDVEPYDMGIQAAELAQASAAGTTDARRVYARRAILTVNRKVAEKMGIVLKKADRIILQDND